MMAIMLAVTPLPMPDSLRREHTATHWKLTVPDPVFSHTQIVLHGLTCIKYCTHSF